MKVALLAVLASLVGCADKLEQPAPGLASVDPALVCDDQLTTTVTVTGDQLTPLPTKTLTDGTVLVLPDLALAPVSGVDGSALSGDPIDLAPETRWDDAQTMEFDVSPEMAVPPGVYDLGVTNPDQQKSTLLNALVVVAPPTVSAVEPNLLCDDDHDVDVTITGTGFLDVGGELPTVTIGGVAYTPTSLDDCFDLAGPVQGRSCSAVHLTIGQGTLGAGVQDVVVTNPSTAACASVEPVQLEVVPAPTLDTVDPDLACDDQGDQGFTLTGTGFVVLADGTTPTVAFGDYTVLADAASGCTDLLGPAGGQSCTTLDVTVPEGALAAGVYDVVVTNPAPADCHTDQAVQIEIAPAPTLASIEGDLVCGEQADNTFTLTGTGFLVIGGVNPTVTIGAWTGEADSADGCTALTGPMSGESCTSLTVTLPAGAVAGGEYAVTVTNPDPAGCSTTEAVYVDVLDAPLVTGTSPASSCIDAGDYTLAVQGDGFAIVGSTYPTVTIGGTAMTVVSSAGCTSLPATGTQLCTEIDVDVPAGTFPSLGDVAIVVTNPSPADCTSNGDVALAITEPPTVTAVDPTEVCETGGSITITGTNFDPSAVVTAGSTVLSSTWVDAETITADTTGLPTGTYDVTVSNPDGCAGTLPAAFTVDPPPIVFYVDPPVTYSGISLQATVYVSGINDDVVDVSIVEESTGTSTSLSFTYDPATPNEILATIPAGLSDGAYDLYVTDAVTCEAELADAFDVTSTLTVAIESVDAPFGYTGDDTSVNVYATDPAPSGEVQFSDLPRLYLNPDVTTATSLATELSAVTYEDATTLDAVVPPGLDAGDYDVLVVNPDGSIGLLDKGFEVTADPVPVIDTISPASVDNSTDHTVTIAGSDFRSASVSFDCRDDATGAVTTVSGTVGGTGTGDSLSVTMPSSSLSPSVCTVTVTNSDGTYVSYAAVSVTSPSANLAAFAAGPSLNVGRRAPAAASGRATRSARYLYAIGGDDGTSAGAMDSIEAAKVGVYGDLNAWSTLPGTLPAPRTLAGYAQHGRFVYVVGGDDGTGVVDTVLRAEVLDPLDVPTITDLALAYGDGTALGEGTWIYRVSALYPSTDASNPGGESLASDPLVVRLPSVPDQIDATLTWSAVSGASGYRVYRTPSAGSGSSTEEWLADVTTTSYTDDGSAATDPSLTPLPQGALGEWATIATLPRGLASPCVTVGEDPSAADTCYLYVAGGSDSTGNVRNAIYYLPLSDVDEHTQTVGTLATSASTLSSDRSQCGAFSITDDLHTVVGANTNWIYFGGGLTDGGTVSTSVDAGLVGAGGDFSSFIQVDSMKQNAGYGFAAASNYLYVFGGQNAAPSTSGLSAKICASSSESGCSKSPVDPPDLVNWNSLGLTLTDSRYLTGSAQESSVIFLVGGQSSTAAASDTVEYTNY